MFHTFHLIYVFLFLVPAAIFAIIGIPFMLWDTWKERRHRSRR